MDEKKTLKRNLWFFPLGTVGRDMMYNLVTNFLLTYILFTKMIWKKESLPKKRQSAFWKTPLQSFPQQMLPTSASAEWTPTETVR